MTYVTSSRTVYIVDGDPDLSLSVKTLLEAHDCRVKMISGAGDFLQSGMCKDTDIILLDLDRSNPPVFKLLNDLMSSSVRPLIILTTDQKSALKPNDIFPSQHVKILVHPVAPAELMSAVNTTPRPAS